MCFKIENVPFKPKNLNRNSFLDNTLSIKHVSFLLVENLYAFTKLIVIESKILKSILVANRMSTVELSMYSFWTNVSILLLRSCRKYFTLCQAFYLEIYFHPMQTTKQIGSKFYENIHKRT